MKRLLCLSIAGCCALLVGGCGAKPGDPCTEPECASSTVAYACENGEYREVPCRGAKGCSVGSPNDEVEVSCDETGDHAGDPCAAADVGSVICVSEPNALQCSGETETWTAVQCPNTCTPGAGGMGVCM